LLKVCYIDFVHGKDVVFHYTPEPEGVGILKIHKMVS